MNLFKAFEEARAAASTVARFHLRAHPRYCRGPPPSQRDAALTDPILILWGRSKPATIEAFCRYAHAQGVTRKLMTPRICSRGGESGRESLAPNIGL